MTYLLIKYLHISCAALSITGFIIRGILQLRGADVIKQRWIKIIPHCIDTVLLASAIFLAISTQQYPISHPWLTAKVTALLVYIGLGMVVIRFGKTPQQRRIAFVLAIACFAYIVAVALTRDAVPWA